MGLFKFRLALPPELHGRFPLRVVLKDLTADDFVRILPEPTHSLTKESGALMATEGLDMTFTEDGIREIAESAIRDVDIL